MLFFWNALQLLVQCDLRIGSEGVCWRKLSAPVEYSLRILNGLPVISFLLLDFFLLCTHVFCISLARRKSSESGGYWLCRRRNKLWQESTAISMWKRSVCVRARAPTERVPFRERDFRIRFQFGNSQGLIWSPTSKPFNFDIRGTNSFILDISLTFFLISLSSPSEWTILLLRVSEGCHMEKKE
jgi:hypothetical protein